MTKQIIQGILAWTKGKWPLIIGAVVIVALMCISIETCVSEHNYKKQIKSLDRDISVLEATIEFKERINKDLKKAIATKEEENAGIRMELRGKNSLILALRADNKAWQDKIETLPPSGLVQVARRLVGNEEIWQREDGILFSLAAARTTINILGQFTFVEQERATLTEAYELSRMENTNLKTIVKNERIISANKDEQILAERGISSNWKGKFNLCEDMRKKARGKGRKEGSIVGFIVGLLAGVIADR